MSSERNVIAICTLVGLCNQVWLFVVAVLVVVAGLALADDEQADPCFCMDAGGVWFALPDICCHLDGRHELDPMDGLVDVRDFLALLERWGPCVVGQCCRGDLDRDGEVGVSDLLLVVEHWGQHPATFVRCRELP